MSFISCPAKQKCLIESFQKLALDVKTSSLNSFAESSGINTSQHILIKSSRDTKTVTSVDLSESGQSEVGLTSPDADFLLVRCDVSGAPHCDSLFCSIKTLQVPQSFLSTVTNQEPFLQTLNLRLSH